MSDLPLKLERLTDVGYLNIRGDTSDVEFVEIVQKVCAATLPVTANTMNGEDPKIYWLGPDEWLLAGNIAAISKIEVALAQQLEHKHAAVNNLSGSQVGYRLAGDAAQELLAKGCTLNLYPDVFGVDRCAQTALAKAAVLISPLATGRGYEIIVRRSFADYLWQWLLRAGRQYRIDVA
ncbi:MAG: sarcosine oxidase subunit gamma [Woeseiaceae bacterium]